MAKIPGLYAKVKIMLILILRFLMWLPQPFPINALYLFMQLWDLVRLCLHSCGLHNDLSDNRLQNVKQFNIFKWKV